MPHSTALLLTETCCNRAGEVIETIEESKAFWEVYDGAVYMFQGRPFLCRRLDLGSRVAEVAPADVRYYTTTIDYQDVHVLGGTVAYPPASVGHVGTGDAAAAGTGHAHAPVAAGAQSEATVRLPTSAASGDAVVTLRFMGFMRIWRGSGIAFDAVRLFLPDVQFATEAAFVRCALEPSW